MPIESVTYISDLDPTQPLAVDFVSEGDDHMRNIKLGLKNTFPNVTGPVTVTQTDLNAISGIGNQPAHIVSTVAPMPADGNDGDFFFERVI